ncbi:hypothetical protein GOBAR_DD12561 [Gossypium barbadense]|nr:hypothetical protein GOBAR_DD12561 [Gossypium barbadense]
MLDFWVKFKEIELYVEHEVESGREGEVGEVQADREGVSAIGIEVDEDIGSIVGEDNDSEVAADEYVGDFATSDGVDNVADEYVGDFATSDGLDNVAAARSGGEKDENETKNKMVTAAMVARHFEATIKDHPKMKLREIQRRCASEMHSEENSEGENGWES